MSENQACTCDTCGKPGRFDAMMSYDVENATSILTYLWHPSCDEPMEVSAHRAAKPKAKIKELEIVAPSVAALVEPVVEAEAPINPSTERIPYVEKQPTPQAAALADALERDKHVQELSDRTRKAESLADESIRLLAESRQRIKQLEEDLKIIQAGRDAAERCLREEFKIQTSLANNGMLRVNVDWVTLANEMALLKGDAVIGADGVRRTNPNEPHFETKEELDEWRRTATIDFLNSLRRGAFKELDKEADEILVVKARAYDAWYKVVCEILSARNIKLKISRNEEFKLEQAIAKQEKAAKETEKAERKRPSSPEDKRFEMALKLTGSPEKARQMLKDMDAAAAALRGAKK